MIDTFDAHIRAMVYILCDMQTVRGYVCALPFVRRKFGITCRLRPMINFENRGDFIRPARL